METLAEHHPAMWPANAMARARARSISAEMHAGFTALRTAMPMNLKLRLKGKPASPEVQPRHRPRRRDLGRGAHLVRDRRRPLAVRRFQRRGCDVRAGGLPFRHLQRVPLPSVAAAYRDAILAHPALLEWRAAGLLESEAHAHYDRLADEYGGPR